MSKKGFTLIELLAVIVILAAIALITTTVVLNLIKDTSEKTFESSVQGVYRTIQEDYVSNGYITPQNYNITATTITNITAEPNYTITYNGKLDEGEGTAVATYDDTTGSLKINIEVKNNSFCATNAQKDGRNEYEIKEGNC